MILISKHQVNCETIRGNILQCNSTTKRLFFNIKILVKCNIMYFGTCACIRIYTYHSTVLRFEIGIDVFDF